ncbi:hypothetical protein MTAT_24190 [Moorella thermoacetica]|uniref:Uncharacterized protein n=1 Tax=Neomoorella thermoacetica TaxID=1525 RepID=A0AAC9HFN5_NEOTH|nr:CRISPR-associated protein Csx15 [Moorella thermoacetica]AOQ22945.1 hypothetical protein Maut_00470 [Moorella thermoacetica]TYL10527.1 hypothetical protein MTAT_24190 [Moorella thermoacetica]
MPTLPHILPTEKGRPDLEIINFAHPLTRVNLEEVARLAGHKVERVIEVPSQIDPQKPLEPQIEAWLEGLGFTAQEWQTRPLLVNLPSLSYSAAVLLAQLHGRTGYFPAILRLRQVRDSLPVRFEVAEILNLQAIRERARRRR